MNVIVFIMYYINVFKQIKFDVNVVISFLFALFIIDFWTERVAFQLYGSCS